MRNRNQLNSSGFDIEQYNNAVKQNNREENYRFAKRLLYNTNITITQFRLIGKEVDKYVNTEPKFKQLKKEMIRKREYWLID